MPTPTTKAIHSAPVHSSASLPRDAGEQGKPQAQYVAEYILRRVEADAGCMRWTGYCFNGHPAGTIAGKKVLIRRALWEAANGPIPRGRILRCTCETPLCIEHIELTTHQAVAKKLGALGAMSGPVRSARIAEVKRNGKQAKISQDDARAIRASDEPLAVLAARHGIAEATVSKIRLGKVRREFVGNPWAGLGA